MRHVSFRTLPALALVALAACASPASPASSGKQPSAMPEPAARAPSRTLVMIARGEPPQLAAKPLQLAAGVGAVVPLFNATLDFVDEKAMAQPYLAEMLPQLNTDSWRLLPDGRMETTYRLRPNIVWHDGTPLAAEDFAFAWRVYSTPELGVSGAVPLNQIDTVVAPDARTVMVHWRRPYPDAGVLREEFQALPRHLLEGSFDLRDFDAFANHPFWTHEYVGLGPYRLDSWEPGAAIEAVAFAGYVLGPPKIDRVRVIFMADTNTALASLLSGDAHIATDFVLMYEQGATLEREWAPRAGGSVLLSPVLYRYTQIQLRPEMGGPRPFQDVRVRRALAHGIDKQAINDALIGGKAVLADTLVSPLVDYYPALERNITTYPYDPRRTQQLMEEAGLVRGPDGFYAPPGGEPLRVEVRVIANPTQESENAIIVEGFRRSGLNAHTFVFPVAQIRDNQAQASFPALFSTGAPGGERGLADYPSTAIPRAENRWFGRNRGGWSNADYDRLWDAYNTTLDRSARIQQIVGMERAFTDDLPAVPHYYTPVVTAHVALLRGPVARITRDAAEIIHVHRWEWQG